MATLQLTSKFTLEQVPIDSTKSLTDKERLTVEATLKKQGVCLIHKDLKPEKNDYVNDFNRGTVVWNSMVKNYAFHRVLIPDGTILESKNFTQKSPHTVAITGKNLTFKNCNLINVEIDPSWTVQECLVLQIKFVLVSQTLSSDNTVDMIYKTQKEIAPGIYVDIATYTKTIPNDIDSKNLFLLRFA